MPIEPGALKKALGKNKYLLLLLALGLLLLLLPRRTASSFTAAEQGAAASEGYRSAQGDPLGASGIPLDTECARLSALLREIEGVGETEVLLSANGCVVVCEGAEKPEVQLCVTRAVSAYTGLGSDRIRIMKMGIK